MEYRGEVTLAIAFIENNKRLVLDILDYEFPAVSKSDDDYDSNWLKVSIDYSDGSFSIQEEACCLLSFELRELIGAIDGILSGRETGYISDFMEPYLSFAVTKAEDTYAVMIKFIYDGPAWNDIYVCQAMSLQKLTDLNGQFKELYEKFPYRSTEK